MIGSALLIIGVFLPIISVMFFSFSLFTFIQGASLGEDPTGMVSLFRIIGIAILVLGIGSLALSWKNTFKPLIGTGVISLGILAFVFIKLQTATSDVPPEQREMAAGLVSTGMGFYVMVLGAIALIVAGVMKTAAPILNPGYGAPPPPPPYTPGN